ncbi:hypothetical protein I302_105574 [Kwoniella bestiolae CBS 10118]|uniref:Major facilitator superfamily (MFS) profile domain-containing protein n=1 Tax=Kwoniella bestiolae CBS 10118 TaxID=1296100 RepID=A0A1B9G1I5_9TREE|nr:hypothetical protein I302_04693 [Kwoniella bestiolae CBS 10118]OCF24883.1 hypothetical protein I302_04693 [Kwoniella bestiolae CBS 10118]
MTNAYNQIVLMAVSVGSFNYGLSFGVASAIIGLEGFLDYFSLHLAGENASYASSMQGAFTGLFFAGGFFGSFFFAWLADKIGRKRALGIMSIVALIGSIISAVSVHIGMLIAGRIITGLASGGMNVIPPMFQSEVSVAEHRGQNVGLHGFMFVAGLATANWAGLGAVFSSNMALQWRLLLALQAVPSILLLVLGVWLPETPRWLILNGRPDEALITLKKLHDDGSDAEHQRALDEQSEIVRQIELDSRHDTSWSALFARPSTRRRILLGIFVMFFQQSTGQNVLYGLQINSLNSLGLIGWKASLIISCYVTWAAVLNFVGAALLDRVGRRTMMLIGLVGTTVADAIHTPLAITYGGGTNKAGAGAAVAFLFLFITFFAPCIDVTSYVYGAEIFPTYMRARGLAVTIATYFAFGAVYIATSNVASTTIGAKYNIIFISLSAINFAVAYYILPETKGLSLEEMGILFGEKGEVAHRENGPVGADDHKIGTINVNVEPAREEK